MKKLTQLLLLAGIAIASAATPRENLGVGFILGNPSGLSLKVPLNPVNSVNVIMGYDLDRRNFDPNGGVFYLGADYVWYNYDLIHVASGRLPVYYGPGLNTTLSSNSSLGIRAVVGLDYQFASAPFDIFFEIGPGINVIPNTDGDVSGGFGARFFF